MTDIDPIDDVRAELARIPAPTGTQLDVQRTRLDAAMRTDSRPARRRMPRRWLPASGLAVAGLTAAVLVAVALQPGSDDGDDRRTAATKPGFRLVTGAPGGAFKSLDLESASAADVLEAAGETAAAGVDGLAGKRWTYVRLESISPNVTVGQDGPKVTMMSIHEQWTDGESGRKFAISETTFPHQPPQVGLYFEDLDAGTIGNVGWTANDGTSGPRRANWSTGVGDKASESSIRMVVTLRDRLQSADSASDVAPILDELFDDSDLAFRDGSACGDDGGCSSFGSPVGIRRGTIGEDESRTMYGRGLLLNVAAYEVLPPSATRALYDYLASLPHVEARPVDATSSDVELIFGHTGSKPGIGERVVLDATTGRVIERGRATQGTTRWTAAGASDEPMTGGTLCDAYPDECSELIDLHERLATDPKAQFGGVVDWMFISQFCDGMIDRNGAPKQGDHLPRSMSKDPKVKAEREACERRMAKAAAATAPAD